MTFNIVLSVKPVGKARHRMTKSGHSYTPEATVNAEAEIRWLLNKENPPCFEGPVYLTAEVSFQRPKSVPKRRTHPSVKPDLSNILKLIEDAANGVLFKDDAQICMVSISKSYGDRDEIKLSVGKIVPALHGDTVA